MRTGIVNGQYAIDEKTDFVKPMPKNPRKRET
jgi:hypothetical protein